MRRVRSERAYEVTRSADATVLARATTDWVYVDIARAMPTRVPRELQAALMPDGITMQTRRPDPWPLPPSGAHRTQRRVELAHLDSVAHVNNARYADYLEQDVYDALAAHGWPVDPTKRSERLRLRSLDLEYLSPALYDNRIDGHVWVTSTDENRFECAHRLREGNRDIVAARSTWDYADAQASFIAAALRRACASLR
jgi:acyl-CoA thioesterase FadM